VFRSNETATNQTLNGTPPPPKTTPNDGDSGNLLQQAWNWVKQTWNSIFGGGGSNQSAPTPNPTMVQGTAQALVAQSRTPNAQAGSTSTPTAKPAATPTPSMPEALEVTYAAHFHLGNPDGVDDPNHAIQPNTVVIPTGAEKSGPYGLMYKEVSVNGTKGWIASNFLEPVPPKNAQPLVEDQSKKVVIDPKFSAGLQSIEFLNINRTSLNENKKNRVKCFGRSRFDQSLRRIRRRIYYQSTDRNRALGLVNERPVSKRTAFSQDRSGDYFIQ
jgi:hypothetical protein